MTIKLTTEGNYFLMEDTDATPDKFDRGAKASVEYSVNGTKYRFHHTKEKRQLMSDSFIEFADIVDSGDAPFASQAALETFLNSNTGDAGGAGSSGGSVLLAGYGEPIPGFKNVASAGTAEALVVSPTPSKLLIISAKKTNTGDIYVANSAIDNTVGIPLGPSDTYEMHIDDVQKVFIDSDNDGDGVTFNHQN